MSRLIDADVLFIRVIDVANAYRKKGYYGQEHVLKHDALEIIEDTPTVEPVKRGKWIEFDCGFDDIPCADYVCSNCASSGYRTHKYCHVCGAKMEVEE